MRRVRLFPGLTLHLGKCNRSETRQYLGVPVNTNRSRPGLQVGACIDVLRAAVSDLRPPFRRALGKLANDEAGRRELASWYSEQLIAPAADPDFETASSYLACQLVARTALYLVLRRANPGLPPLSPDDSAAFFRCFDIAAVRLPLGIAMNPSALDRMGLPEGSNGILNRAIAALDSDRALNAVRGPELGAVFEALAPVEERRAFGQFFTPSVLCDLMVAYAVPTPDARVLDPTCGSGAFLLRACNRIRSLSHEGNQGLGNCVGFELARVPAQLAAIALIAAANGVSTQPPQVTQTDFFDVPPDRTARREVIKAVVTNLPFVRKESLEERRPGFARVLESRLAADWALVYPEGFELTAGEVSHLRNIGSTAGAEIRSKLSASADLYVYALAHAAAFLEDGGRMAVITSNAWLDAEYGGWLREFILAHFKIEALIESRVESWFDDASINTVVLLAERCTRKSDRDSNVVPFVQMKRPIAQIMDGLRDETWAHADDVLASLFATDSDRAVTGAGDFAVRRVRQRDLAVGSGSRFANRWGLQLRADHALTDLLDRLGSRMQPLTRFASVNYGTKPGLADFFFLRPDDVTRHRIEAEFLQPILTTIRHLKSLVLDLQDADKVAFVCSVPKEELHRTGKSGALRYIAEAEQRHTTGLSRVGRLGTVSEDSPSVRDRSLWYSLPELVRPDVVLNQFIGQRYALAANPSRLGISNTFFGATFRPGVNRDLASALLNWTPIYYVAEAIGRVTWSQGVLYLYGPEWKQLLVVDPASIDLQYERPILDAYAPLSARRPAPMTNEVQAPDRRRFDSVVGAALGVSDASLQAVYDALVRSMKARRLIGDNRRETGQPRHQLDLDALIADVAESLSAVEPQPPARRVVGSRMRPVSLPPAPLRKTGSFLTTTELAGADGTTVVLADAAARYVLYSSAPESLVEVPEDDGVTERIVHEYEQELRHYAAVLQRELSVRLASNGRGRDIARLIFKRRGLEWPDDVSPSDLSPGE